MDDIRFILDQFSPDYLSLCEANFDIHCNVKFPGYNIEYNRLHISNTVSRSLVLIKNSISYTRRYDLENPYISSIWLNIKINRNHNLIACSYYRQWQLQKNLHIPNSNSKNSQIDRYKIFSKQVQKANKDKANIVILEVQGTPRPSF